MMILWQISNDKIVYQKLLYTSSSPFLLLAVLRNVNRFGTHKAAQGNGESVCSQIPARIPQDTSALGALAAACSCIPDASVCVACGRALVGTPHVGSVISQAASLPFSQLVAALAPASPSHDHSPVASLAGWSLALQHVFSSPPAHVFSW